ncbi:hypothetical protein BGX24_011377 [Mortierella sp. AD032]|nr:hypothetical protein BGX24_011377 [Mortierella sp. AD032]
MTGSNKDGETLLHEHSQVFKLSNGVSDGVQKQQEQLNKIKEQGQDGSGLPIDQDADKDKANTNSASIRWRSVACGWAFTVGLTEPFPTPYSHEAISISTSNSNQAIYAWGSGSFGELGLGPGRSKTGGQAITITTGLLDSSNTNVRGNSRFELVKVRAGLRHVLLLAKEIGDVGDQDGGGGGATRTRTVLMGWGSNRQGQLGVLTRLGPPLTEKELRGKFMEPTRIVISPGPLNNTTGAEETHDNDGDEPNIVDMACGQNHSLVLFSNGTVYSSGLDKYGQLGPRTAAASTKEKEAAEKDKKVDFRIGFEPVVGLPFVDSISCGWNHNASMDTRPFVDPTAMTTIYLWGRNDHGQLGGGVPLRTLSIGLAGALEGAFEGIVQVQIPARRKAGVDDESEEGYEPLVSYSCGSEHTLAMTRSGACYAWGWNEHGNCGGGIDSAGNKDLQDVLSPRLVQFPTPSNSLGQGWVMGGYGSSWVWT